MSTEPRVTFKPGDRVRYRFAHRDTGTIVKSVRAGGDWLVRWDHVRFGPDSHAAAYEENLELLPPEQPSGART